MTKERVEDAALIGTAGVAGTLGTAAVTFGAVELGKALVASGTTMAGAVVASLTVGAIGVGLIVGGGVLGVIAARKCLGAEASEIKKQEPEDIINLESESDKSESIDLSEYEKESYRQDKSIGESKLVINHSENVKTPEATYAAQVTNEGALARQ
jgi:hypothetical protein